MNIEQSHVQLAALRAASFLCTKIKAALPSTTEFDFFEFAQTVPDVPCLDQKDFFQNFEDCAVQFFMEWFSADNEAELSVRRRIALQGIKDTSNEQFWKNIESLSNLPRLLAPVETALAPYEKAIKKEKKSTFPMFFSEIFYKQHHFLTEAKQKGGVVSCDKNILLEAVRRQFVGDLTQRFNQILESVNITSTFVPTTPWLSPKILSVEKTLEKRVFEQREKASGGIVHPPARSPTQVSY